MRKIKLQRFPNIFWITGGCIALFYLVVNFARVQLHGDDFYFAQVIQLYGSAVNWLVFNYTHWSGRIVHFFYVLLLEGDAWPFRVLNSFVMVGELVLFFRMGCMREQKYGRTLLLLLCGVQVIGVARIFESMFWPVAMVLYCWGMLCTLLVLYTLESVYRRKKVATGQWIVACLAACYTSYAEQPAAVLLGFLLVFGVAFRIRNIPIPGPFWIVSALTVLNTAICLLAPGNAVRTELEIVQRWPDYDTYGLFRKLSLGISYTLEMLTGNLLRYLLIAAALLVLANLLYKRWIPLALSIVPAGYYGLAVLQEWFPALRAWLPLYDYMPGNDLFGGSLWAMFCTCLGVSMFVLLALAAMLGAPEELEFCNGFLLLAAFASLLVMCATPTIYASGSRCGYVSNVLINLVAVRLWGQCLNTGWFRGWKGALTAVALVGYSCIVAARTLLT